MIQLHVEPSTVPMKWSDFVASKPTRSIALDGYVSVGPRMRTDFQNSKLYANFNHHEGVPRLETRATCAQVLLVVREGLLRAFADPEKKNGDIHVYVNDCDEDVSLSVFILQNQHLAVNVMNPLLNQLVSMEDMLDTTAGAYSFPEELVSLRKLMWTFAPYHNFRVNGGLDKRDPNQFRDVISDVGRRIMAYITGRAEAPDLDTRYEKIRDVSKGIYKWSMVHEIGPNARIAVYADGAYAFHSSRQRSDGRWMHILGRKAPFIPYPIPKFLKALNRAEGNTNGDLWGGSDTICGSPRVGGSKYDPDEVSQIMLSVL